MKIIMYLFLHAGRVSNHNVIGITIFHTDQREQSADENICT
jgi:hypothetical protein